MSEVLTTSLQKRDPQECEEYLTSRIDKFQEDIDKQKREGITILSSERHSHLANLRGLRGVLQDLMANIEFRGKEVRLSYMKFDEAFSYFMSFRSEAVPSLLVDRHQRKIFVDLICNETHGIPVYILKRNYIVLKTNNTDLELLFEELLEDRELRTVGLSANDIKDMLDSLDSQWDKKVFKVALGAKLTKTEQMSLGLGSRVAKYKKDVYDVITAKKELQAEAESAVVQNLQRKVANMEKSITSLSEKLSKKSKFWNTEQLGELQEELEDMEEKKVKLVNTTQDKNSKPFKQMVSRKIKRLNMNHRLGMRKTSTGRPRLLDEQDEKFILDCIEQKATAHGRRHDAVMYTGKRVKKKDFLKLANFSRLSRGLKPIQSATTVYNRARPKNKRNLQSKRHIGLGLFCSKKPPKLQETDNLLTHHQRALKKNIIVKHCHFSHDDSIEHNMFLSRDDKAYICPGTSTGKLLRLLTLLSLLIKCIFIQNISDIRTGS